MTWFKIWSSYLFVPLFIVFYNTNSLPKLPLPLPHLTNQTSTSNIQKTIAVFEKEKIPASIITHALKKLEEAQASADDAYEIGQASANANYILLSLHQDIETLEKKIQELAVANNTLKKNRAVSFSLPLVSSPPVSEKKRIDCEKKLSAILHNFSQASPIASLTESRAVNDLKDVSFIFQIIQKWEQKIKEEKKFIPYFSNKKYLLDTALQHLKKRIIPHPAPYITLEKELASLYCELQENVYNVLISPALVVSNFIRGKAIIEGALSVAIKHPKYTHNRITKQLIKLNNRYIYPSLLGKIICYDFPEYAPNIQRGINCFVHAALKKLDTAIFYDLNYRMIQHNNNKRVPIKQILKENLYQIKKGAAACAQQLCKEQ